MKGARLFEVFAVVAVPLRVRTEEGGLYTVVRMAKESRVAFCLKEIE